MGEYGNEEKSYKLTTNNNNGFITYMFVIYERRLTMEFRMRKRLSCLIATIFMINVIICNATIVYASYPTNYPNDHANTGDQAKDIAAIAETQVGYAGNGDRTKYCAWYYGKDTSAAWCAIFISWCANQAGIPTSIVKKNATASGYSVSNMGNNSFGTKDAYSFSSSYTPKAGDIAYIDTDNDGTSNHVGLVVGTSSSNIYMVEGNTSSDVVKKYTYSKTNGKLNGSGQKIVFFAVPAYKNNIPSTPTIKSKSSVTEKSVKLSWDSVSGATKYKLEYRQAGDSWSDATSKTVSSTSYEVSGLNSGKLYWFRLYAGNDSGWSSCSESYGVYLKPEKPTAYKTGVPGSIKLSWTNAGGNTKYAIYVRKSDEAEKEDSEYAMIFTNQYSHTFENLTPGAQYYFKVKEYNIDNPAIVSGRSESSTNFTKLSKPTITGVTANSVSLSWIRDKMDGAYSYSYIVRRGPGNAGGPENSLNSYYNISEQLTNRSWTDTSVSPNTTYDYYIDVYRTKDGQTVWCDNSEVITVTTGIQEATGISVSTGSLTLKQGESYLLSANVYPDNANNKTVTWVSGDSNIATVGSDGTVTAINVGSTNIYARTVNGYEAVCNVTVNRNHTIVDLGDDFNAYINYDINGKYVTREENSDVQLRSYSGKSDQKWHFVKQSDGSYKIFSLALDDYNVLDVSGWGDTSGTNVGTYYDNDYIDGNSSSNQRWYIIQSANGYRLKPQCSECMLDVEGGGDAADGTQIRMWEYLDYGAQEFYINKINSNDILMGKVVEYNGHFYQGCYVPGLTWNGANTYAQKLGGHLATISDEQENEFILNNIKLEGKEFFIGFNDIWDEGNFTWSNGESVTYTNWSDGEPNNAGNNEDAVHIRPNGEWNDADANTAYDALGFIVEYEPQIESEFEYNGHKYIIYSITPTWDIAEEYCEKLGGHLVTINDAEENAEITSHLNDGSYYIGASSIDESGANWEWVTGEPFEYSNWDDGEPNNTGTNEPVVEIYSPGKWNDVTNNSYENGKRGFICEIIEPESISFDTTTLRMERIGQQAQLTATILPENAVKRIMWESSNSEFVTVDNDGMITTNGFGCATITAKTSNGKTAECEVIVRELVIDKTYIQMNVGDEETLRVTTKPGIITTAVVGAKKPITWTSSNTEAVTILPDSTSYSLQLKAKATGQTVITAKTSDGFAVSCIVDVASAPLANPTITSIDDTSKSEITVKWNAVEGATSYRLDRKKLGDSEYTTVKTDITETQFTDSGLENGERYYYQVYAVDESGNESGASTTSGGCTKSNEPSVSLHSTSEIELCWNSIENAENYTVRRRRYDGEYEDIATVTETSYTDTELEPGTKYYYWIKANCKTTDDEYVVKSTTTGQFTKLESPTAIPENNTVKIQWQKVNGKDSYLYRVMRRASFEQEFTELGVVSEQEYTDNSIKTETVYYYYIDVLCNNEWCISSDETSCTATVEPKVEITNFDVEVIGEYALVSLSAVNVPTNATIYLASYNSGKLLSLDQLTLNDGSTQAIIPVTDISKIKVFVWDVETIKPLCSLREWSK